MGAKRARLDKFLNLHPMCYFCGGIAITEDHVPSRECFRDRIWPEGYVFPACEACNGVSSQMEQVVAMYLHMGNKDEESTISGEQLLKLIQGVANNNSAFLPRINLTTNELRRAAQRFGVKPPPGGLYSDLPIAELPAINRNGFQVFERRLGAALYYKHLGEVMPRTHIMMTTRVHMSDPEAEGFANKILPYMQHVVEPRRQDRDLSRQFMYAYAVHGQREFTFLAQFGMSYLVLGSMGKHEVLEHQEHWIVHEDDLSHLENRPA